MKLHRDLKVTQKTAWFMLHRIRESWAHDMPARFEGPVESDETYFGGKKKNMALWKRKEMGTGIRGLANKIPVHGVLDRKTKQVAATVLSTHKIHAVQDSVYQKVKLGAVLYSDEGTGYRFLVGFQHEKVKRSAFEYVRGDVHTNSIESFWATMKRAYVGTFHHLSAKHLWRYVNEFVGRYNVRDEDTIDQMKSIAKGLPGRRLTYQELTS